MCFFCAFFWSLLEGGSPPHSLMLYTVKLWPASLSYIGEVSSQHDAAITMFFCRDGVFKLMCCVNFASHNILPNGQSGKIASILPINHQKFVECMANSGPTDRFCHLCYRSLQLLQNYNKPLGSFSNWISSYQTSEVLVSLVCFYFIWWDQSRRVA